jgi:indole-3-acetate monooxygenase
LHAVLVFHRHKTGHADLVLGEVIPRLRALRLYQDDTIGSLWAAAERGEMPGREQRAELAFMLVYAAQTAHEIAETVCEVVGAQSIYRSSPFDRRRRDLATVAAHVVSQRKSAARAAQLLFDSEPQFLYV